VVYTTGDIENPGWGNSGFGVHFREEAKDANALADVQVIRVVRWHKVPEFLRFLMNAS
jgi:hypothetical protein